MDVNALSLRARSTAIALVGLLLFTPLAILAIDKAYAASLREATFEQLKLKALMLISEFEFDNGVPTMPSQMFNDQLNLVDSGVYGLIKWEGERVWQSASTEGNFSYNTPSPPETGEEILLKTDSYFIYAYTAEYEVAQGYSPVSFFILVDISGFNASRNTFLRTLWIWMGALNAALFLCLLFGIRTLLTPLSRLTKELAETIQGSKAKISSNYPKEITPLSISINRFMDTEHKQRERYKNSLSDLAHSLKTPLTVALGETQSLTSAQQPLQQIKHIIERQLKRASSSSSEHAQVSPVCTVVDKLMNAMNKVYADKHLKITSQVSKDVLIRVDNTDLLECLGNLMDNACKAAASNIVISTELQDDFESIHIDDDGPGVEQDQYELLIQRGQRLDTYGEGQGIGLALVNDIATSYGGMFNMSKSHLGGARATLSFPRSLR